MKRKWACCVCKENISDEPNKPFTIFAGFIMHPCDHTVCEKCCLHNDKFMLYGQITASYCPLCKEEVNRTAKIVRIIRDGYVVGCGNDLK